MTEYVLASASGLRAGLGFAVALAAAIAVSVYLLGGRDLRLGYVLPERSVIVPYNQVARVVRRPAYKSLWRLQVYTVDGRTLQSTRGAESAVVEAATALEQRLAR